MRIRHVLFPFLFIAATRLPAQNTASKSWRQQVIDFREHLEWEYMHEERTPLTEEDKAHFKGLAWFPARKAYRVWAKLQLTPEAEAFDMMTSSGATRRYRKYGELQFSLQGRNLRLSVYQNLKLMQDTLYRDHLFLPFKDLTCGKESYGGGRYIDLHIPDGDSLLLDFNQCYNPYCAYSSGWNCPIVPDENHLDIRIPAGVKKWHD